MANTINNIGFKIKTFIRRWVSNIFKLNRPSSYPYLSGDGFRCIANFIHDQFTTFNPCEVGYGNIIFVRNDYLLDFFKNKHPKIKEPYVLISHNEDCSVEENMSVYIDDKILHWYAQNLNFKHPKVTLLPIGLQNFSTGKESNFIAHFNKDFSTISKRNRVLYGFSLNPKIPKRTEAFNQLSKSFICDQINKPRKKYYENLCQYKFIASPEGGGKDCHRTWEALYYKVIPILIRNDFSEQIEAQGFPVLLIDDWSQISDLNEDLLNKYYETKLETFNNEKMYLSFWYNLFSKHRIMK